MKNRITITQILSAVLMILTTLWLCQSSAYTDYQCVQTCTSRGLQYDSCVEKCSDDPQPNRLDTQIQNERERLEREHYEIMRRQQPTGMGAFDRINGGR